MAHEGIFATADQVKYKAGANASSTATAEAYINAFIDEAESEINAATRYNWSDAFAGLNDDVKAILQEAASNLAAAYIISYDMSGFTTLQEAQTMIQYLMNNYNRCIGILKDLKTQTFVQGA